MFVDWRLKSQGLRWLYMIAAGSVEQYVKKQSFLLKEYAFTCTFLEKSSGLWIILLSVIPCEKSHDINEELSASRISRVNEIIGDRSEGKIFGFGNRRF